MNNEFRVLRGFYLDGLLHQPGETLAIDSREDMSVLLHSRKIEPANEDTADNLKSASSMKWSTDKTRQARPPNLVSY